jgi:hypothetical protein
MLKPDFRAIIDYWPTYSLLSKELGLTPDAIKQMRRRDRIPACHWLALIRAAEQSGYPEIELAHLAALAQERMSR